MTHHGAVRVRASDICVQTEQQTVFVTKSYNKSIEQKLSLFQLYNLSLSKVKGQHLKLVTGAAKSLSHYQFKA